MKKWIILILLIAITFLCSCQQSNNAENNDWESPGITDQFTITPMESTIFKEDGPFFLSDEYIANYIVVEIENTSEEKIVINNDFYRHFGMAYSGLPSIGRMDAQLLLDAYFDIFIGDIEAGEKQHIPLYFISPDNESYTLIYGRNDLSKNNYEFSWKLP